MGKKHSPRGRGEQSALCSENYPQKHLIANCCNNETAGNAHRTVRNTKERKQYIAADKAHQHDGRSINASPISLLTPSFLTHALCKTDEERHFGRRIRDGDERDETAEEILKMEGFKHGSGFPE